MFPAMYFTLGIVITVLLLTIIGQHCYYKAEYARMKSVATDALEAVHESRQALSECKKAQHLRLVGNDAQHIH